MVALAEACIVLWTGAVREGGIIKGTFEGAARLAGGKFEARSGVGGQIGRTAGDGSIRRRGVHSATGYQPVVACR